MSTSKNIFNEKNLYKRVVDNLHEGLYFVTKERVITYWNKGAELISGFKAEEVVGHKCSDNILTHVNKDGESLCMNLCPLAQSIDDLQTREAEVFMHHKDGHRIPVSIRVSPMFDETGELIGGFEVFSDISNRQANELRIKELEKLSHLDHLTQLSNRAFIEHEIESRLAEYERHGLTFGILFIDIDFFKKFNDTYGHDVGDNVLKFIANTFTNNCRPFDIYGRWGGEEFIGVIKNVDMHGLSTHGNKIRQLVEHSYLASGENHLSVTISMGGTLVQAGDNVASIVKRADELLYQSKSNGRNQLTTD